MYIKALPSPRDSTILTPISECLLTSSLVLSWICVFSFNSSSEVNLLFSPFLSLLNLLLDTQVTKIQSQTGRIVKGKHISRSIHTASHLLNNKLAEKVSFHQCITVRNKLTSCLLSVHSWLMFLAFIFIPYLNKRHLLLQMYQS